MKNCFCETESIKDFIMQINTLTDLFIASCVKVLKKLIFLCSKMWGLKLCLKCKIADIHKLLTVYIYWNRGVNWH